MYTYSVHTVSMQSYRTLITYTFTVYLHVHVHRVHVPEVMWNGCVGCAAHLWRLTMVPWNETVYIRSSLTATQYLTPSPFPCKQRWYKDRMPLNQCTCHPIKLGEKNQNYMYIDCPYFVQTCGQGFNCISLSLNVDKVVKGASVNAEIGSITGNLCEGRSSCGEGTVSPDIAESGMDTARGALLYFFLS